MPTKKPSAYDLKESQFSGDHAKVKTYADLAVWLSNELDFGISARLHTVEDIRYAWTLYEQGRTRGSNSPWPDAADLTSPFAAEFTDALHADAMQTIFVDPVWLVEGWGESASKAPFIEEFLQRTQEDGRLQGFLDAALLRAFVEGVGTLEVSENVEMRRERKRMRAQLQLDEATQAPVMGEDLQPQLATGQDGNPIETQDPQTPSADVDVDTVEPVRVGPDFDVIPYLEFLQLPSHARTRSQVWGYAKRFYRRVPELLARADQGIYDAEAVQNCGEENERQLTPYDVPEIPVVVSQDGPTAQKELWEVSFLANLDGDGERWWRATVHRDKRVLLRLKVDDHTTRYIRFIPFPKPGSLEGYSLILHKMLTVIEEDTAVRNMRADKAALAIAAPVKKLQGSLWDPFEQPFGPKAVIDVRDMNEVQQMVLSDVPQSINVWKNDVRIDAERLIGRNDVSMGTTSQERRTLGEVKLTAMNASVRTSVIVKRFQESLEELAQALIAIWKRTLSSNGQQIALMQRAVIGMEARGIDISSILQNGQVSADMLEGQFWFKPNGSVDTANLDAQAQNFMAFMKLVPEMAQMIPAFGAVMGTPQASKAIIEQALRVLRWPDKQAFLGSAANRTMQQHADQMQQASDHQALMNDPKMRMLLMMAHGANGGSIPPQLMAGPQPPAMPGQPPAQMPAPPPQQQAPPPDHSLDIARVNSDKEIQLQKMRNAAEILSNLIDHYQDTDMQVGQQAHELLIEALQPAPAPPTQGAPPQ